ncbi:DUF427 domain-containing protein [Candidatus Gracilibacteria bacterium]|nr:DUF427 domain-containing protein [Thermales bacterium]NJL97065.1 DUF427 domain-containing protein [Candidatus Gracilibacteria bacterium]
MSEKIIVKSSDGTILAQGNIGKGVVHVEGNYYFDKSLVNFDLIKMMGNGQQYTCPIKRGTCDYYNLVNSNGETVTEEIGWVYEKVNNEMFKLVEHKMAFYSYGRGLDILTEE